MSNLHAWERGISNFKQPFIPLEENKFEKISFASIWHSRKAFSMHEGNAFTYKLRH